MRVADKNTEGVFSGSACTVSGSASAEVPPSPPRRVLRGVAVVSRGLLVVAVMMSACLVLPDSAHAQGQREQFEQLLQEWDDTPRGSEAEASAFQAVKAAAEDLLSPEAIVAFRRYLDAPIDSDDEAAALADFEQLARAKGVEIAEARFVAHAYLTVAEVQEGVQRRAEILTSDDTPEYTRLYYEWLETPADSEAESTAATAIRDYVIRELGQGALSAARSLAAGSGGEGASDARSRIEQAAGQAGIPESDAAQLLRVALSADEDAGSAPRRAGVNVVDGIRASEDKAPGLLVRVNAPVWTSPATLNVIVEVVNNSAASVFYRRDETLLRLSPGLVPLVRNASRNGEIPLARPDGQTREELVVRVPPGQLKREHWELNVGIEEPWYTLGGASKRFRYWISFRAAEHQVWARTLAANRILTEPAAGRAYSSEEVPIVFERPLGTALIGAIFGALLMFLAQFAYDLQNRSRRGRNLLRKAAIGAVLAGLLAVVVVLVNDFVGGFGLIQISVVNFRSAIVAGILVQALGYGYSMEYLRNVAAGSDLQPTPTPSD